MGLFDIHFASLQAIFPLELATKSMHLNQKIERDSLINCSFCILGILCQLCFSSLLLYAMDRDQNLFHQLTMTLPTTNVAEVDSLAGDSFLPNVPCKPYTLHPTLPLLDRLWEAPNHS